MLSRLLMRAALAACALAAAAPAAGQVDPVAEAVVFVRVFGRLRAEYEEAWRQTVERRGLEFATGSGFVVSPSGYILTNHHVINGEELQLTVNGREVKVSIAVERIDVVFGSGQRFEASVLAADPALDLAVLTLAGAANLPYMPLGDSDAVPAGAAVTALGYPFGRSLEVGRAAAPDVVPNVTVTPGTVSAIRDGDDAVPRFLQITNAVNPGNSGGPIIDDEGYAVGIVAMRVTKGDRVGFAIAINRAKDFLEQNGLDGVLPTRRLSLGPMTAFPEKGLRLRLPYGFQDGSDFRLRVDAGEQGTSAVALRVDRLASPWTAGRVERALAGGGLVEPQRFEIIDGSRFAATADGVTGRARALLPDRRQLTMEYRITQLGAERIVARYVGPSDEVAFNRGAIRASLASLEAEPLLRGERVAPPDWAQLVSTDGIPTEPPAGWMNDPNGPLGCRAQMADGHARSASPLPDFTQTVRFAWWPADALATLRTCAQAEHGGAYVFKTEWAGVEYAVEGYFLPRGNGVQQIEGVAPADRAKPISVWLRELRAALEGK